MTFSDLARHPAPTAWPMVEAGAAGTLARVPDVGDPVRRGGALRLRMPMPPEHHRMHVRVQRFLASHVAEHRVLVPEEVSCPAFNDDVNTFFKASSMSENFTKRDNIAIGSAAKRDRNTLPNGPDAW